MCNQTMGTLLGAPFGVFGAATGNQLGKALKPPKMPELPGLPASPRSERTPDIPAPKRRSSDVPSLSSTVLTGALGIDPKSLTLGKTLLGGA